MRDKQERDRQDHLQKLALERDRPISHPFNTPDFCARHIRDCNEAIRRMQAPWPCEITRIR